MKQAYSPPQVGKTKFELGQVVATPGALKDVSPLECGDALARHAAGDWGIERGRSRFAARVGRSCVESAVGSNNTRWGLQPAGRWRLAASRERQPVRPYSLAAFINSAANSSTREAI
jgi:hypothetical protein